MRSAARPWWAGEDVGVAGEFGDDLVPPVEGAAVGVRLVALHSRGELVCGDGTGPGVAQQVDGDFVGPQIEGVVGDPLQRGLALLPGGESKRFYDLDAVGLHVTSFCAVCGVRADVADGLVPEVQDAPGELRRHPGAPRVLLLRRPDTVGLGTQVGGEPGRPVALVHQGQVGDQPHAVGEVSLCECSQTSVQDGGVHVGPGQQGCGAGEGLFVIAHVVANGNVEREAARVAVPFGEGVAGERRAAAPVAGCRFRRARTARGSPRPRGRSSGCRPPWLRRYG